MPKTINDFPEVKKLLDDCANAICEKIGLPVTVHYKINVHKAQVEEIINAVCQVCNVTWPMMQSKERFHHLVAARQVYVWFCTKVYKRKVTEVARELEMDHTTIIHSRDRIDDLLSVDDSEAWGLVNKVRGILFKTAA